MAGKTITMSNLKQIIRHRDNGMALQTISKTLGISPNRVKKYLQLVDSKALTYGELLIKNDEELDVLLSDPDQISEQRPVAGALIMQSVLPYRLDQLYPNPY